MAELASAISSTLPPTKPVAPVMSMEAINEEYGWCRAKRSFDCVKMLCALYCIPGWNCINAGKAERPRFGGVIISTRAFARDLRRDLVESLALQPVQHM